MRILSSPPITDSYNHDMGLGDLIENFVSTLIQLSDTCLQQVGRSLTRGGKQAFTTIHQVLAKTFRDNKITVLFRDIEHDGAKVALCACPNFKLKGHRPS